jgi:hypothetical protein
MRLLIAWTAQGDFCFSKDDEIDGPDKSGCEASQQPEKFALVRLGSDKFA